MEEEEKKGTKCIYRGLDVYLGDQRHLRDKDILGPNQIRLCDQYVLAGTKYIFAKYVFVTKTSW